MYSYVEKDCENWVKYLLRTQIEMFYDRKLFYSKSKHETK